jgi:hypothetical protein
VVGGVEGTRGGGSYGSGQGMSGGQMS